jgi:hypothetical protein
MHGRKITPATSRSETAIVIIKQAAAQGTSSALLDFGNSAVT